MATLLAVAGNVAVVHRISLFLSPFLLQEERRRHADEAAAQMASHKAKMKQIESRVGRSPVHAQVCACIAAWPAVCLHDVVAVYGLRRSVRAIGLSPR